LPRFGFDDLEYSDPKARDFYTFEVGYYNPGGSGIIGHYAVHRATGNVWELIACKRLDARELRTLQSLLRKRIGLRADELKRLNDVSPCYAPD
jgi:hypothetical protein